MWPMLILFVKIYFHSHTKSYKPFRFYLNKSFIKLYSEKIQMKKIIKILWNNHVDPPIQ